MTSDKNNWIQTMSGMRFHLLDPRPEEVRIDDIAHALSNLCRFNGHTETFYSVAQHSVLVSQHVPPEHAKWALLHDASEAYLGDMVRPLKVTAGMQAYREAEERVQMAIAQRFGLPWPEPPEVKRADIAALLTERRDLLAYLPDWPILHGEDTLEPWPELLEPQDPMEACVSFIVQAKELGLWWDGRCA